ncbi:hypothetical protein IHE45_20G018700 [Dioscorea alata]|uniref:Uncharacterized protein n=1 Tax=Dioscorea alata TaxID=55571 RepID=A0ACB7TSW9_DIOAL|nr:hypothetical protein IHE45_20G018700 [Dioscorea alata]
MEKLGLGLTGGCGEIRALGLTSGSRDLEIRTLRLGGEKEEEKSVQKIYNTLNSQLAATEQLSNCLSEQLAMLNINKQSVRHPIVVKELFELIGISQEASIFHSPESFNKTLVSASIITKGNSKINMSSTSQVLESGTARRRYSLDKSLSKFEPQKTTVKRMLKERTVSVIADKHVGKSREAFHSQTANFAIENHAPSFSQPSSLKWHSPAYPTGKGQPLSSSSSTVVYNNPHGIPDGKFQLPDSSSNIVTHTASQSGSSIVSKTAPSSKRMSNVPFNTSPQTSVTFSSNCTTNFKTTLPSEIMHEKTSGQVNQQSGKDAPTKLSIRSLDNFGVSEKGLFSLSDESTHSIRSVAQSVDGNRIAQVDVLTGHSASPEASSTSPFNFLASASTPVFSTKQSSTSLIYLPSSTMASIGKTSFDTKPINDTNKTILVSSSVLIPSTAPHLPSSNPLTVQSHESPVPQPSAIPFESAVSHCPPLQANMVKSNSESPPLVASKSEGLLQPTEINPLSKPAVSQALAKKVSAGLSEGEPSIIPTASFSTFPLTSGPSQIQSTTISPLSTIPQEKDDGVDLSSSQEDEMEEEALSMADEFLGGLGGFGLGATSPHVPKSNPFGVSFNTTPASAPFSLTSSPGELLRPASFSIPPPKPNRAVTTNTQALGSVLGAFGQSRQIGAGVQGIGFASSGDFGSSGAAGGFAGAAPGGGFASVATGGGFASAPTGGGFAGAANRGGFASTATGGFAAAAAGGGFAAVGSQGGGFAAAASGGSGGFGGANPGGGFAGGGFGAFSGNKVGGFSGFRGSNAAGAGGPPSQLFTQMRK